MVANAAMFPTSQVLIKVATDDFKEFKVNFSLKIGTKCDKARREDQIENVTRKEIVQEREKERDT